LLKKYSYPINIFSGMVDFMRRKIERLKNSAADWADRNITYDTRNGIASFLFWSVPFAPMELGMGKPLKEVAIMRGAAAFAHVKFGKYVQPLREKLADKWGVYKDSSWIKKQAVNVAATAIIQPPTYLAILTATAILRDHSFQEFTQTVAYAMPRGWTYSIPLAPVFGLYLDKFWGLKDRTFKERPVETRYYAPKIEDEFNDGGLEGKLREEEELLVR
jgi:hypothetical protein